MTRLRWYAGVAILLAALAMAATACGDGSPHGGLRRLHGGPGGNGDQGGGDPAATAEPGGVSSSSVAPNTFLTYEGNRYRLVDLEQANLIDETEFAPAGTASQADIDQEDLTVYSRTSDPDAIYTYAPEAAAPTEVAAVEGESGNTPALWYRWVREP